MTVLAALLSLAAPVAAQAAPPAPPTVVAAPVAPETLAEARIVVRKLVPPGIYKQVMGPALKPMIDNIGATMGALPLKQVAELGGLSAQDAAKLDRVNVQEVMAIYDPHWQERTRLTMGAMIGAMGDFFTTLEPELREAMAHAYANNFTLPELTDMDRFFATPSGAKFAGRYMTIAADPAMAAEMQSMMPKLMGQMPRFVEAAQKATAGLPAARKLEDLSAADRARLAKALGVSVGQLHDPKAAS